MPDTWIDVQSLFDARRKDIPMPRKKQDEQEQQQVEQLEGEAARHRDAQPLDDERPDGSDVVTRENVGQDTEYFEQVQQDANNNPEAGFLDHYHDDPYLNTPEGKAEQEAQ